MNLLIIYLFEYLEDSNTVDYIQLIIQLAFILVVFILGLFGNRLHEKWKEGKHLNSIYESISKHLEIVLKDIAHIKKDYVRCKSLTRSKETPIMGFFINFNNSIFMANSISDLYKMHLIRKTPEKFMNLNSIYSLIDFLKDEIPGKIFNDYVLEMNEHLSKNNINGLFPHSNSIECENCIRLEDMFINRIDQRITDVGFLEKAINKYLSN